MTGETMLADSHIHLFERGFVGPDGTSPAGGDEVVGYERYREHFTIDAALVVGYEGEDPYRGNNAYLAGLAREFPWVRPTAYLERPATHQEVAELLDQGFCGVSVYAVEADDGERLAKTLRQAAPVLTERRAVVSLNVAPAVYGDLRQALADAPEITALISHFGLPAKGADSPQDAQAALRELHSFRELPGVVVKASGFYALSSLVDPSEALAGVVEQFGHERVVWGSDYPVVLSFETLDQATEPVSVLSDSARQAVMGDNLRRILARVERA